MQPFASIPRVLEDYNMFGFVPLMKPISLIPGAAGAFSVKTRYSNQLSEL